MRAPKTRYAWSSDGTAIAYQVVGDGPRDLIYVPTWLSHVEHLWEHPSVAEFFERLSAFSRLILFDRRGAGLSDRLVDFSRVTLEDQMDDVLAVMEAAGSERAALFAQFEGGPMAMLFAASLPERTTHLGLHATWARATRGPDYPHGNTPEQRKQLVQWILDTWGEGVRAPLFAPSRAGDDEFKEWFGKLERLASSPGSLPGLLESMGATDVTHVLPTIRVPTMITHRTGDQAVEIGHSRYLAEHIPGARFKELPGEDSLPVAGDTDTILGEMEEFMTGSRQQRPPERVLATVLFTDIVGSTERAAELGDRRWREVLASHDALVRRELERFRGREVKTTGDGFLATFDGPARAINAASEIARSVRPLGIEVRAGLHTGECEVLGDDVGGLAVHIGARVTACAGASEVLVSSTVKDLVVGSGIQFEDRGVHELKGVPGEWRLFAAGQG